MLAGVAWWRLLRMAGSPEMDMMAMPDMAWGAGEIAMATLMWAVMMAAMMLPSATPMVLMFVTVNRRRAVEGRPLVRTGLFVLGYVVVWVGFSAAAAGAQWALHAAAMLSDAMAATSPFVGGTLLVAAGLFQWTPLKTTCLTHCRSPLSFLMTCWREGARGALVMGLRHGAYCVGCCWVLMALLFVAGVMNLLWVAALAAFVLIEKLMPGGDRLARLAGVVLVAAGVAVLTRPLR